MRCRCCGEVFCKLEEVIRGDVGQAGGAVTCSCTVEGDDREHAPSCPRYSASRGALTTQMYFRKRAEKAEAAVVSAAGRILTLECSVANAEARAERAEAERDALKSACAEVIAKARDLLEAP